MLSSKDDPLAESARYKTNNQYGFHRGDKLATLPGTAGTMGIGSLGSPLDKISNSNEFNRVLSPNFKTVVSPMAKAPSTFRGRGGSTHNGGMKLKGVQNRAMNSIEFNSKFEDLGL